MRQILQDLILFLHRRHSRIEHSTSLVVFPAICLADLTVTEESVDGRIIEGGKKQRKKNVKKKEEEETARGRGTG
jgi:hypothetical protein